MNKYMKYRRTVRGRYTRLIHTAREKGVKCTLTFEQYEALVALPCFYCHGSLPVAGSGLDQKRAGYGYTLANVLPCCMECNRVKGDVYTVGQMLKIAVLLRTL